MFKKLVEKMQHLTREPIGYDPSHLGDSIAMETEWTPREAVGPRSGPIGWSRSMVSGWIFGRLPEP